MQGYPLLPKAVVSGCGWHQSRLPPAVGSRGFYLDPILFFSASGLSCLPHGGSLTLRVKAIAGTAMKTIAVVAFRFPVVTILILIGCSKNPADSSEPANKLGYLYVVNRSPQTISINDVAISEKPISTFWRLPPDRYTVLTVDPENVNVIKQYPSGTIVNFTYSWESEDETLYELEIVELKGTMTGKFRYDPLAKGRVSFYLEEGDTKNEP